MATFNEGNMVITGPIQHKRGTSAALAASSYVPAAGTQLLAASAAAVPLLC